MQYSAERPENFLNCSMTMKITAVCGPGIEEEKTKEANQFRTSDDNDGLVIDGFDRVTNGLNC